MSKLKTNDVRYIVLEGGGARGAAYLGAIKGLQREFDRTKGAPGSTFELAQGVAEKGGDNALMDYVSIDDKKLKILGVAGSSAGAITSYALALGLNAKDIEEHVMKFEFKNFLSADQEIPGKYRMIDKSGNLMVGCDAKRTVNGKSKGLSVVGLDQELFEFDLKKDESLVLPNEKKQNERTSVAVIIVKVILDGVVTNLERVTFWVRSVWPFGRGNFGNLGIDRNKRMTNELFQGAATFTLATQLPGIVNKIWGKSMPFKITYEGLTNALFDSGMFSGFKVREFFFDVTIFGATRETRFRRCLIKAANEGKIPGFHDELEPKDLDFARFTIGKRSETDFPDKIIPILKYLQHITFQQLYELTGVEFAVCVSNLTSNLPLYFSHKWTPDFRVQEAVGASMTIPPAIKPLYNESEVSNRGSDKSVRVNVWGAGNGQKFVHTFVDAQGNFSTADYHRYEYVMKKALQEMMQEKGVWISTNNVTDISTFLPLLRDLVVGEYDDLTGKFKKPEQKKYTVVVEGITYTFGKELFHFFYNAAYYGMFVDGGYRCNIPYNIFRKSDLKTTDELKQTLAIKLDGGFPAVLTSRMMSEMSSSGPLEANLEKLFNAKKMLSNGTIPANLTPLTDIFIPILSRLLDRDAIEFITVNSAEMLNGQQYLLKAKKVFVDFYKDKVGQDLLNELGKNDAAINKLIDSLRSEYRKGLQNKPWEIRKGISVPMAEGYAYGSELGQLRFMSDHNYIIPLYSCGIGTYDFDLDKVKTLVKLSQEVSEKAIEDYFK